MQKGESEMFGLQCSPDNAIFEPVKNCISIIVECGLLVQTCDNWQTSGLEVDYD